MIVVVVVVIVVVPAIAVLVVVARMLVAEAIGRLAVVPVRRGRSGSIGGAVGCVLVNVRNSGCRR